MDRLISLFILAAGVVLCIWGVSSSESVSSSFSRFFTGSPTEKTVWLLAGGVILGVIGLVGLLRGKSGG